MKKILRISLYVMAILYMLAGLNHFLRPQSYLPLMPPYIPAPELMNYLAGIAEVLLGLGLIFKATRKWSAWGVILMLLAFLPVHIYFIQVDSCIENSLCLPPWAGWVRLVLIHPVLLGWAFLFTKER
ncbi:MauE/DoxX family redox-associated membrane protein [Algoriphagus sp.]|uniref:DoxX family protein n=1 Tax=Algoriphagus sp. TaxID=1872435 RepID=UPI0032987DF2